MFLSRVLSLIIADYEQAKTTNHTKGGGIICRYLSKER